jgi:hypothetical protein
MQDGSAEGHALLHDWLTILAGQYNHHILGLSADTAVQVRVGQHACTATGASESRCRLDRLRTALMRPVSMQADVAFEAVEALQPIPRLTYGLLRSPLLVRRPDDHPDSATAARLLWVGARHSTFHAA